MDADERYRKAEEWLEANREDIEGRVALFKAAHSALCKQYGLHLVVMYQRINLFADHKDLHGLWVANLYD